MEAYLTLPKEEKLIALEQTAARTKLPPRSIEKDFWVVWMLKQLFALPEIGPLLTFKGGTSLSKAYGLIQRFSEDIDLIVDRAALGFEEGGVLDPVAAPSPTNAKKRTETLRSRAERFISETIFPRLKEVVYGQLDPATCKLELRDDTRDPKQIDFHYPSCFPVLSGGYILDAIKLELNGRSDSEPANDVFITPYLAEVFPSEKEAFQIPVHVIAAERTFLDKATLLHEEKFRPREKEFRPRLSRHYYDLACLIKAGVGQRAVENLRLFEQVVEHRKNFYPTYSLAAHPTMKKGTLSMIPTEDYLPLWEQDYQAMKADMFYGEVPHFTDVMQLLREFEDRFNAA